jgi:ketosteroid isomerase-like protein
MAVRGAGHALGMSQDRLIQLNQGADAATRAVAERFLTALGALEGDRELDALTALFSDDAELRTSALSRTFHGTEGAREFWRAYRDTFGDMDTTYDTQLADDGAVMLEWETVGESAGGERIRYRGVSVLRVADGHVTAFRAYFDPAALVRQLPTA